MTVRSNLEFSFGRILPFGSAVKLVTCTYAPFPQSDRDSDVAKKWVLYSFLAISLLLLLSGNNPEEML